MNLSELVTTGKITRARKGIIYGVEGIGKTTLASQFPGAIIIDTERGADDLDLKRIKVRTPERFDAAITALLNEPHDYKTVVIDTVDWLEEILTAKVCKKHDKEGIEAFGYGKGWTYLREEFDKLLFRLDQFIERGVNVVFIGHSQIKRIQPPEATDGYDHYQLKLDQRNAEKIKEWADFVLFVNWLVKVKEKDGRTSASGGRERGIFTVHTAAYDAKNRAGLDEQLKFEIAALQPLFPPAADDNTVEKFVSAMTEVDPFKLFSFLTAKGILKEGQQLIEVDKAYARRVLNRLDDFKKAINDHAQNAADPVSA